MIWLLLSDIDCFDRDAILQAPGFDVFSSDLGDILLKLESDGRERRVSGCGVFDVETGAAADLEQPGSAGEGKRAIDGFNLECFHRSRRSCDQLAILVFESPEFAATKFAGSLQDQLVMQTGYLLQQGQYAVVLRQGEFFGQALQCESISAQSQKAKADAQLQPCLKSLPRSVIFAIGFG